MTATVVLSDILVSSGYVVSPLPSSLVDDEDGFSATSLNRNLCINSNKNSVSTAANVVCISSATRADGHPRSTTGSLPLNTIRGCVGSVDTPSSDTAKYAVKHDCTVHDPLGAGAYAYEKDYTSAQLGYLGLPTTRVEGGGDQKAFDLTALEGKLFPTTLRVCVEISRNAVAASPHVGITTLISYAFLHAKELKAYYDKFEVTGNDCLLTWKEALEAVVDIEIVNDVSDVTFQNDGVEYRRATRDDAKDEYTELKEIVHRAAAFAGNVQWNISTRAGVTGIERENISQVLQVLLTDRERLGRELFPLTSSLSIQHPCPVKGCGIVDVAGRKNVYVKSKGPDEIHEKIEFHCPEHGYHTFHIDGTDEYTALGFGGSLYALVRVLGYGLQTSKARTQTSSLKPTDIRVPVHVFVTGGEWAGTYNENSIWRQLLELAKQSRWVRGIAPPVIAYVPTIQDWSGSRLSTLSIASQRYQYLKEVDQGYLLSFTEMKREGKDITMLFRAVEDWMKNPFRLFRPYSLEYIHRIAFGNDKAGEGTKGDTFQQLEAPHDNRLLDSPGRGADFYGEAYISAHLQYLGLPTANNLCNVSDSVYEVRHCMAGLTQQALWGTGGSNGGGRSQFLPTTLVVHIGAQPNNSPHAGTVTVFVLSFLLAREIKQYYADTRKKVSDPAAVEWLDSFEIVVQLDLVDTAPDKKQSQVHGGLEYQRSQRFTKGFHELLPDYEEVMKKAADFIGGGIPWSMEYQTKLTKMKNVPQIVEIMLDKRGTLGWEISPKSGDLGLRRACPDKRCGYAEKHGRKTTFERRDDGSYKLNFFCHEHKEHSVHTSNAEEVKSLEFNTPLRNLLRGLAYGLETTEQREKVSKNILAGVPVKSAGRVPVHMRVTGSDYTGTYSEQLFWRQLFLLSGELATIGLPPVTTPVTVYAPLILDWAGSKISKSLYVKSGAYEYLRANGMGYFLSYADMKEQGKEIQVLFAEVERWVKHPRGLFRPYSVDYLHGLYERASVEREEQANI